MSHLLCEWLNGEVRLSRHLVPGLFPEEFSTGYLLGELLHKYGLQDDFEQFSKSRIADAKISNFSRLEPTFHLLGVKFDKKVAQNIMTGQHGAATNLLYELYIALEKRRKAKLTGVAEEPMRPAAPAKPKSVASGNREHYVEKRRENEVMARNQTAVMQIKKQPPRPAIKSIEAKRFLKKKREAQNVYKEIEKFEKSMTGSTSAIHSQVTDSDLQELLQTQKLQETTLETILQTQTELLNIYSDDEYIRKIQKRLEEDKFAREQRAKRRRRMLVDQLAAHEIQEKAYREEQLIYRLMKQSQHERRIAAELMHVRHEKEVLKQNRIFREKQYEERRQKEFQEALDREAALAKQEKIDNEDQIIKEREYHERMAAERAQARYKKHYSICWEMISQIIDLSTKIGEYRQRMNNRVPFKLILDWKECFLNGKPIYEQASIQPLPDEPSPEQLVELNKMSLLDERDYGEYKSMTGKWSPTEENSENKPPLNNNILGHVLRRMMEMFYPPKPKSSPDFPSFPVKGCILGKMFSGKTTCAKFIGKVCNIQVLSVGTLVQEAIEAFLNNEMKSEHDVISQETEISMEQEIEQVPFGSEEQNEVQEDLPNSPPDLLEETQTETTTEPILDNCPVEEDPSQNPSQEEFESDNSQNGLSELSVRAQLGSASQEWLKRGKSIPDELLIDILLEAISRIPPEKGWIVEGFPMTINQAKLFEKSYTGFDLEAKDPICEKMSLAIDPRVPKEPPPISPAFDVSILLDVSDSVVLNRAVDVNLDKRRASQTEQNSNQNSDTEILEERIDIAREQVLHRISGFLKTWPKLEKWFSVHRNTLVKVNAETEESLVCETVKEIIIEEIAKHENRRSAEEIAPEEEKVLPVPGEEEEGLPVTGEEQKISPVTDQPLPSPEAPPPAEPGSDEWIYVDEPLAQGMVDFLVPYWEMVENTYVNTIKTALRCLREEHYRIVHYTADIRKHFQDYLKRPDNKQAFVSQWQTDFNSVADDLQDDEETKAELHQRVSDLRDLLWDICNSRKEEAEQERTGIMNEEWLPDRRGLVMNHFFTLMQAEVDRFQDTKKILHDYYRTMEGKITTEEESQVFTRIPLLDIINGEQKEDEDESRRIPLVSWKPPSPSNAESEYSGNVRGSAKDKHSEYEVVTYRSDENLIFDTWQTAVTAVSDMVTAELEAREMEEEQERQLQEINSKAAKKQAGKATGKDKKGAKKDSSKASNKKKGGKASVVPEDPEELRKQEVALKIKQEYFSALKHEEGATTSRLELIKEKALAFVEDLKFKAEEAYKDMEKWLGSNFLAEVASVEKLIEVARHHVESSSKIQYEIILEDTDFFINGDIKVFPDPPPPPVPPPEFQPLETSGSNILTISQLNTLHNQFLQLAPKGFLQKKLFVETLSGLVKLNLGINCFSDAWTNLTLTDLENLASAFTVSSEFTDWRRFLLAVAQPWPVPSVTQLLKTLHAFKTVDVTRSGFITQEQYLEVGLWFNGNEDLSVTGSCKEPVPSDRLKQLIKFFFSLFAFTRKDPALLNYTRMLLYFACHSDPVEGVYRALSVASGTHVHRKKKACLRRADSSIFSDEKTLIEDEKEVLNYPDEGKISMASLLKMFPSGGDIDEVYHRYSDLLKAESYDSNFIKMYQELGSEDLRPIAVELLLKHPFMKGLIHTCQEYSLPDMEIFLQSSKETQSTDGDKTASEDINT